MNQYNSLIFVFSVSILLSFISYSHSSSEVDKFNNLTIGDDSFLGAVIEYGGMYNGTGKEQVLFNLKKYVEIVSHVMSRVPNISIIVFPEAGLQKTHGPSPVNVYGEPVPDGNENITPCSSNDTLVLKILSCLAQGFGTNLVVNLIESHTKTNATAIDYYNTNVVLNRNGRVIARYRKYNIYGIDGKPLKKPAAPDLTYFDTDFGVRFGTFTCFDIAFKTPALDLVYEHNITHFVFPVGWVSELPFLTALQMQAGWARANNVVLMAAGLNDPSTGSTGSGIYAGSNVIGAYQTSTRKIFAVIGIIPKNLADYKAGNITSIKLRLNMTLIDVLNDKNILELLKDKTDVYRGELLAENTNYRKGDGAIGLAYRWSRTEVKDRKVCFGLFCCKFSLNFTVQYLDSVLPQETVVESGDHFGSNEYMIIAFDGVRSYGGGVATGGIKVCALVSCVNRNVTSCAIPTNNSTRKSVVFNSIRMFIKTDTIFNNISVETEIEDSSDIFVMPDAFSRHTSSDSLIIGSEFGKIENRYNFEHNRIPNRNIRNVRMVTTSEITNPGAFGIYARVFSRDGMEATTNVSYIDYYDPITESPIENKGSKPGLKLIVVLSSICLVFYFRS